MGTDARAAGTMVLTGRTPRPKVSDLLRMPLGCFQEARVGVLMTLGPRVAPPPHAAPRL